MSAGLIPRTDADINLNALVAKPLAKGAYAPGTLYRLRQASASTQLLGNHTAIKIALSNVYQNAIKYSVPESVVTVGCTLYSKGFQIDVHDLGNPIPPKEQPQLFKR